MKKLVFLHGAGADCAAYRELMNEIASFFGAELVCFNAPFSHPAKENKFVWFNKIAQNGRRDAVNDDYYISLQFIKDKLYALDCDLSEIILIGHSQGGGMAVHVGLELNLGAVIDVSADLPYNIFYDNRSLTPIYWFEAGKDGYIDENRKASYKILEKIKADFYYQVLPNSTHNEFESELLPALKERFRE